jgi:plasmid stabilization system protein ParE
MSQTSWSSTAESDVEDIYDWIARQDRRRSTAKKVVRELRDRCDALAEIMASGSLIGTASPQLGHEYRVFTHKRWVIVFRALGDGIEVMRVLDGNRDFPRLFP